MVIMFTLLIIGSDLFLTGFHVVNESLGNAQWETSEVVEEN